MHSRQKIIPSVLLPFACAMVISSFDTGAALAQGTLVVSLVPRHTQPLDRGDSITIDLVANYDQITSAFALAAFRFDVVAATPSGAIPLGPLDGNVNRQIFRNGPSDGTDLGATLAGFGGAQLPAIFGGGNPSTLMGSFTYTFDGLDRSTGQPGSVPDTEITFTLSNFKPPLGALSVYISPTGTLSRVGNGLINGEHFVQIVPARIPIVPIPAPSTLVCAAVLLAPNRRRATA